MLVFTREEGGKKRKGYICTLEGVTGMNWEQNKFGEFVGEKRADNGGKRASEMESREVGEKTCTNHLRA